MRELEFVFSRFNPVGLRHIWMKLELLQVDYADSSLLSNLSEQVECTQDSFQVLTSSSPHASGMQTHSG